MVDELVDRVGEPQALVSYHLGRLRAGGLVSSRRSSQDGRAVYYRAQLDTYGSSLAATGPFLHPGLGLQRACLPDPALRHPGPPVRVLFACTGNSARSQIAEALLQRSGGNAVDVVSGGSHPKPVHRYAVEVLAERGIDISSWRSKSLSEFSGHHFDYVVTLCDKVRERCPQFAGDGEAIHWSIEDPSSPANGARVTLARFRRLAADLDDRINWLSWEIEGHQSSTNQRRVSSHD